MRSICLALIAGLLILHVPLDVFRAEARPGSEPCAATSCCDLAPRDQPADAASAAAEDEQVPPTDDCAAGCHCACCGGLPIATAEAEYPPAALAPAPSATVERLGVRHDRPRDVFHPPRA